jgi:hypothetical protein
MSTTFLNEKRRLELKVEGPLRAATSVIHAWLRTAAFLTERAALSV